ncbi:SAM domain (Sterile alpha motif) [Bradyrhizobium shewense]|uniref:SAM domain (Sterile alpha motif) n=1 Tax=Bradyrhizobium shewense TaxID=1761772 RepID=A0A1C3XP98_9BRAD|nr:SAM domain-containing protein [Bradyrhizobium shewense]SCB54049.1 SAM domain (Sterile alpha motif) [Bradyrhizobium shewense]
MKGKSFIDKWLTAMGLTEYCAAFAANHIDLDILRELTAEDLESIGVSSVGHRRKLMSAISALAISSEQSWTGPAIAQPFDPIALIDRLVRDAVAQRLPGFPVLHVGSIWPIVEPEVSALTEKVAERNCCRMSDVLAEFLKPLDRKRKHTAKGRGEAAPVVQFAVELLGNPRMDEITEARWNLLDEALPDIPNRDNIPRNFSQTLFQRYKYAETANWSKLKRVTTTTIKSRYWAGLYKFIDFAIAGKHYRGPRPKFVCIDPETWRRCRAMLSTTMSC